MLKTFRKSIQKTFVKQSNGQQTESKQSDLKTSLTANALRISAAVMTLNGLKPTAKKERKLMSKKKEFLKA